MNTPPPLIGGPFLRQSLSVSTIMLSVMLALTPGTLYGLYQFGWPALNMFLVTIVSALATEALSLKIMNKPIRPTLMDGSAVLAGWLLALTLPPWAPWWIGAVGGLFAIGVGKQVYGGLGQNLFNPAMMARVVLLVSFPVQMTFFVAPHPLLSANAPSFMDGLAITFGYGTSLIDTVSSASVLGYIKTEAGRGISWPDAFASAFNMKNFLFGAVPGSLGETSAPLLLLGGLFLLGRRIISWHIPVAMIGAVAFMATLLNFINPATYPSATVHVLSGALLLGAFFIATDPVTSPVTPTGKLIYGALCGLMVYLIRTWGGYPEGMAFAVLLLNAATPLIDRYFKPRVYGRTRRGQPLVYEEKQK